MKGLTSKLRIGEKIALGFGVVGLIFLGVIWHYHASLHSVLADYRRLNDVYGARQSFAFEIEQHLGGMRTAEERFLGTRDLSFVSAVEQEAAALTTAAKGLAQVDAESGESARKIEMLAGDFLERFKAIVEGWRVKGLDEDAGLQGAFRDRAHELEARAGNYNVDRPYLLLLQIRRGEKDLGLRREARYQGKVEGLVVELAAAVASSSLPAALKQELGAEIETYGATFGTYAGEVLAQQGNPAGKGPFRDAAHRIEDLLEANYVPDLEVKILQLRRREKDYLLRGDDRYVAMVQEIAAGIRAQIAGSRIADSEKAELQSLLEGYQRDFLALVEQDRLIALRTAEMYQAADRITPLAQANLAQANQVMAEMTEQIARTSAASARLNLIIAACATALGILFAYLITTMIVRPVRDMAGLLDRLTYENPTERVPTAAGGRDEINDMAISLNTMADHKATFFNWWRASMQEAISLRDLHQAGNATEQFEAAEELRTATLSKMQQINNLRGKIRRNTKQILEVADRAGQDGSAVRAEEGARLRTAAAGIDTLLDVLEED